MKKKQMSVNLPVELIAKVKSMAEKHGVNEYDHCSQNQMFMILVGLGIEAYETREGGKYEPSTSKNNAI